MAVTINSTTVDETQIVEFDGMVTHVLQECFDQLEGIVNTRPVKGAKGWEFTKINTTGLVQKERHQDIPLAEFEHDRIQINHEPFYWATLLDDYDRDSTNVQLWDGYAKALGKEIKRRFLRTKVETLRSKLLADNKQSLGTTMSQRGIQLIQERILDLHVADSMDVINICSTNAFVQLSSLEAFTNTDYKPHGDVSGEMRINMKRDNFGMTWIPVPLLREYPSDNNKPYILSFGAEAIGIADLWGGPRIEVGRMTQKMSDLMAVELAIGGGVIHEEAIFELEVEPLA